VRPSIERSSLPTATVAVATANAIAVSFVECFGAGEEGTQGSLDTWANGLEAELESSNNEATDTPSVQPHSSGFPLWACPATIRHRIHPHSPVSVSRFYLDLGWLGLAESVK
jgi:hypothetical protein